jgi:hypothetical protein
MAPEFSFGPMYCETLSAVPGVYPVEPFNAVSNGVIVMFGLLGFYYVYRRVPKAVDLYIACAFLTATGVGSGIWHGFRDGFALFWEVRAGLYCLFAIVFCWARRLWTTPGAGLALVVFYFAFGFFSDYGNQLLGIAGRWVAITPLVVGTGILLISQTAFRSRESAMLGGLAVTLAIVAVTFRTIDLDVCGTIPMGTHFLWHSFLSAGAFTGILAITRLPAETPKWLRWGKPEAKPAAE